RPSWAKLAVLSAGATLLLLGALAAYLSWSQRRGRRRDRSARDFARLVRKLARRGVAPRAPAESAAGYAARAAASLPGASGALREILRAYHAARYEPDPNGIAEARLHRLVGAFRA